MSNEVEKHPSLYECEKTLAVADKTLNELENGTTAKELKEDTVSSQSQSKKILEVSKDEQGGVDECMSIAAMKKRIKEMQMEATRIEELQAKAESFGMGSPVPANGPEADVASIYVGNVDYATKPQELQTFFSSCGAVQRVTILTNKWTGHPKGYAYVQFRSAEAVANAVLLNDSEFKGRQLIINEKRTNIPGYNRGYGSSRGGYRGYRGRGYRGRSRGYRSRGWSAFTPY